MGPLQGPLTYVDLKHFSNVAIFLVKTKLRNDEIQVLKLIVSLTHLKFEELYKKLQFVVSKNKYSTC